MLGGRASPLPLLRYLVCLKICCVWIRVRVQDLLSTILGVRSEGSLLRCCVCGGGVAWLVDAFPQIGCRDRRRAVVAGSGSRDSLSCWRCCCASVAFFAADLYW